MMLKAKQKGFTLLELLVVITLLAILSVGALVAYDGLTEKAQAAATSNNTATVDRAIRSYRVITQEYPDQWDNLADGVSATGAQVLAPATRAVFGNLDTTTSLGSAVLASLEEVGVEEIQQVTGAVVPNVVPNLQHNEGANPAAQEVDTDDLDNIAIFPSRNTGASYDGTLSGVAAAARLNKLNDNFETDFDHLVVALGFGHDAAHSTTESKAAIATAATYTSKDVDPSKNYARYIGLFHVGTGATSNTAVVAGDIFPKARFVGIVDPEGNGIDDNIAEAIAE